MRSPNAPNPSRRAIAAAIAPLLSLPLTPPPALAFNNRIDPGGEAGKKTPGPTPTGLGYRTAPGSSSPSDLKPCLDGRPHCFSSSKALTASGETTKLGTDWVVQPWTFAGKSQLEALDDVKMAVDAYPPGQAGIDGGGFQVVTFRLPERPSGDVGYLYVQFESQVSGFIDDMEFAVGDAGTVNVRTSSRSGYLDFGVNAKRYNWFAKRLAKAKGWKTRPVMLREHADYFGQNDLSDADVGL